MSRAKLQAPTKEELKKLRETMSLKQISDVYFVHESVVGRWLSGYGLTKPRTRRITDEEYKIADINGINRKTVYHRVITCGWTVDEATTKPVRINNKREVI